PRRRHAPDGRAAVFACHAEEPLVEITPETGAALIWRDTDEMDVRLVVLGLGQEPDQKAGDRPVVPLGHEARAFEMEEEELRQHRRHVATAPPRVDVLDHAAVVGRLRVANRNVHGERNASSTGTASAFASAFVSLAIPITASNSPYCSSVIP